MSDYFYDVLRGISGDLQRTSTYLEEVRRSVADPNDEAAQMASEAVRLCYATLILCAQTRDLIDQEAPAAPVVPLHPRQPTNQ